MDAQALHQQLLSYTSSKKFLIAYSGGLDSHVLLHMMASIRESLAGFQIRAMYVNHGLQQEADSWSDHCQNACRELSVPFETTKLSLKKDTGESVEALAREGRYGALERSLQKGEVLLTAHHQNDQAETLLLQLFRGAGVNGLSSMPIVSDFGVGLRNQHMRPLLGFSRESLNDYAKTYQLETIEDPSNLDVRFDRNFLRQTIIPQLKSRWQGLNKVLSRVATIQSETKALLDEVANEDLNCLQEDGRDKNKLSIAAFKKLSKPRQKLVLRYWIKHQGYLAPSNKKIDHFFSDVLSAQADAAPVLAWQGVELRRYQDHIYIMSPLVEHNKEQVINWNLVQEMSIPELDINIEPESVKPFLGDSMGTVTIRFRMGGERIFIPQKGKHVTLKKLFQEKGVPPWERSRIPLVYVDETLVYIHGLSK